MDDETDLYTHIEFIHGEVHFNSCSEPIPFWPLQSTEELINLKEVKDHVYTYFSGLTTGQFLCIVKTAQNFEAYGLCVNGKSTWYNILTEWMSHFNKTDVDCKALRALYNRRLARFKEIQKRCNVRGNLQMKSTMIEFLNSAVCLPKRKMSTSAANVVTEAHQIPSTVVSKLDSQQFITLNSLIKVKQTTSKSLKKQNSIIKKQTEKIKEVSKENDDLKITLMSTDREHKILKDISGNEIALKNENDKLKKRNTDLFKKAKKAGDLERKSKFQERKIINMTKELKHLTDVASSAVCQVNETDRPDSEKQSLQNKLCTLRNELKSAKKKVQRRENNISKLHDKISCVRDKLDTDKKAIELYYTGIVDSLKNQHELSIEKVEAELASLKELETKTNGKYQAEIRLMYYDLLTKGVSANTVQNVVKTVLEHTTNYDVSTLKLPSRTSAQRMVSEAGSLVAIRTAYEMAKSNTSFAHQSDGTTKHLIHWGAHAIKMAPNNDPTNPNFFTLTVSPVLSGKADDTVDQLQEQFSELNSLAKELDLDSNELTYSVTRIESRMSDRAANEKK